MEATEQLVNATKKATNNAVEATVKNTQVVVFKIGNEDYGMMIDQIKEVVITPNITKIPLSPHYVKGVANVRGNILAIIDLEQRFGIKNDSSVTEDSLKPNYTLVVESDDLKMGILVREVPNTLTISESQIDQSPNVLNDQVGDKNYIKGLITINKRLIILIDVYKIINSQEVTNSLSVVK